MEELLDVRNRLLVICAGLAGLLTAGSVGYRFIEKWPWFDALYMTVITLGTVGYGETHELSRRGRAFTMVLILVGIGLMTYAISTITSIIVEGDITEAFKRRRMQKEIDRLTGHYIICGGGHAGNVIASELKRTQRPFVAIDREPEGLAKLQERLGQGE